MKKNILLFAVSLFLFSTNSLLAQDVSVTWGKNNASGKRDTYKLLGETSDNGVFVLRTGKKSRKYLEKYASEGYTKEFSKELSFSLKKNSRKKRYRISLKGIYVLKDVILILATKYDKKTDKFSIYAKIFDFNGNEKSGWKELENVYSAKSRKKGKYEVEMSKDKSKLLIKHTVYTKRKELEERYAYSVFDNELIRIYKKEVVFSKKSKKDGEYSFGEKVSNAGDVYFFSRFNRDVTLYSLGVDDDDKVNSENLKQYKLEFNKKRIVDIAYFENEKDNSVVITGFYSDKTNRKNHGISGVVYIKLNSATLEEENAITTRFTDKFMKNYVSSRRIRKGKGISTRFDLKHLIFNANGDAILIAENTFMVKNCRTNQNTGHQTCTYTYHFNSLMIIGINANGEMKYATNLKKYSAVSSPNYGGVSYSVLSTNIGIVIFYNGHYKDFREGDKKVRRLPSYKRTVLVKAFISNTGELTEEAIIRHKEVKLYIMPRYTIRTSNKNGLLMLGFYKKIMKIGKFEAN